MYSFKKKIYVVYYYFDPQAWQDLREIFILAFSLPHCLTSFLSILLSVSGVFISAFSRTPALTCTQNRKQLCEDSLHAQLQTEAQRRLCWANREALESSDSHRQVTQALADGLARLSKPAVHYDSSPDRQPWTQSLFPSYRRLESGPAGWIRRPNSD